MIIKRRRSLCFLTPPLILWMHMVLCVDAQDRLECMEVTYLEVGKEGMISCSLDPFYAISWYTKEDYVDDGEIPLLHFNGEKDGRVDEYDIHPSGSFIFRNVSFNHAGNYIVTMLPDVASDLLVKEVYVEVYVTPDPPYPVVEGLFRQQHVYMDVSRNGQLSCSMRRVYPNISLEWTVVDPSQSKKILFQDNLVGRNKNEDNTFDIALTSLYEVTDQSVRRITIQCGVVDKIGEAFSSRTKVDLLFSSVYPVVNGHVSQKHVYLDVDKEGHLTCIKENVDAGTTLVWKLVDPNIGETITFQSREIVLDNNDGTVTINQTFDYEIHDHLLDRITIECEVIVPDEIPVITRVDLLLQNVYPVVNGHVSQKHVYLDVDKEGHLTCIKENVDAGTTLVWKLVDPNIGETITFQSREIVLDNNDGTVTINQTFDYEIHDHSLDRITIECEVIVPDEIPVVTRVDLLLQNVYPVVNGLVSQKHVYLDVDKEGHLTCLKENVDAGTTVVWKLVDPNIGEKITFQSREIVLDNNDGTVTINQTFDYEIHDHLLDRITIECEVIVPDEIPVVTRVDLLLQNVYPVVNGLVSQKHVYLDVDKEGHLTCIKENVDAGTTLVWKLVDPNIGETITFQSREIVLDNNDGTVTINQTFDYEIHDHSLDRITIECEVIVPDEIPVVTRVDLLLQNVYPVVNGHVNQRHVYLDVGRNGHLSCVKKNADAGSTLVWVVDPTLHDKIMSESNVVISNNSDGTVNIKKRFDYEICDYSLDRITIECKIIEPHTDEHPLATKVDLLFQNVYPVVNGHVNQNHVYLDVDRMGHLTCVKENVNAGTTLDWVLDPNLRGKVTFQSRTIISIKSDDTVNINQTFDYEILDNSLDRITLECREIELDSVEHPFTTTVELLFSSDPIISGCFHEPQECVLQVERSGELTCTVKNSHHPVDLKWTTLDGEKQYLVFEKTRVKSHNSTNLYDVSITTPYTLVDKSVTSVTVQCEACRSHSGQVLAVAKTSLEMTGDNINISTLNAVLAVSLSTTFLLIALGLLVLILWYKNRKMHKEFAVKFLEPLVDRSTHYEYSSPEEGTIGTTPYFTANGVLVRCPSDVLDANRQEVQDMNESLDSPDSGNTGSNSRELSGSEASEKSNLMDDIEMTNNSKQATLRSNTEGFESSSVV